MPAVILIDQYNALYALNIGQKDCSEEVSVITELYLQFFLLVMETNFARGSFLLVFSSLFKLIPLTEDGDSILSI